MRDRNDDKQRTLRRSATASVVGSTIEWYDFTLFGTAAAFIFGGLFFPSMDPVAGAFAAFAANAVGIFIRPLGGLIFGSLGDRIGRKALLAVTLVMMGIATTLIGLLPTYASIGLWAPALLVACRVIQGLGAGAEFGGSVVLVAEHAPEHRRGFYTSLPMAGVALGLMLGTGMFSLVSLLPDEQLLSWGWRIPFLLSAPGVALGLWIRLKVTETEEFIEVKKSGRQAKIPALAVIRSQPRSLIVGALAVIAENGTSYLAKTFVLTYVAVYLGMSKQVGLTGVLLASAVSLVTLPLYGSLADRFGARRIYFWSAVSVGAFAFPFFWLLNTETTWGVLAAIIVLYAICVRGMSGTQGAFLSNLYEPRVRVSGVTMSKEIASPLAGGISPLVATALLGWSHSYWPVAVYLIGIAAISAIAVTVGGTSSVVADPAPKDNELHPKQPVAS